ncbi:Ig kappa chain V-V region T1 [Sciurus carolinensis]|uniref:Ig kappa chain V-V region T1 n=1 Tax=Sciurus carolinensis TaxID=30640 RepID=A0AA41MRI8_SCICA|nr:Ig kappa chain V-V region T1 [Sciurus carolinensis]
MDMRAPAQLLGLLLLFLPGLKMNKALTQSPALLAVYPGERTTINCTTNPKENTKFSWYQQKPGQIPKLLMHGTSTLASGVPAQFSGRQVEADFTLSISNVETTDTGNYYCVE